MPTKTGFGYWAPSTVSKHLSILRNARLVDSRMQGRWMYYRLSGDDVPDLVTEALTWILSSLAESPKAIEDEKRLEEILKIYLEILCSQQAHAEACHST